MPTRTTTFATNDNVTANDLNALAGAWNSYTPTLGVFTAGNGTASGSYLQFGKLVMFRARFVFGSTSTAATGQPTLTLPVTASSSSVGQLLNGYFVDSGTAWYAATAIMLTTTTVTLAVSGTNGIQTNCTTTVPFTWTTGDSIQVAGLYEAA